MKKFIKTTFLILLPIVGSVYFVSAICIHKARSQAEPATRSFSTTPKQARHTTLSSSLNRPRCP